MQAADTYIIPSVDRTLDLLELLAEEAQGLSLAELARRTGFPKSTVFRILATLEARQVVVLDLHTRRYHLGHLLWSLGHRYVERSDLYEKAAPVMQRLAERSGETVFLGKLEDGEIIYMRRIESPRSIAIVKKLGQRVSATSTATGRAILAFLPAAELDGIIERHGLGAYTASTVTDVTELRRSLAQVHADGFAIVNGEYNSELLCISAPVFDHTGHSRASITIAMPGSAAPPVPRQRELGALVREYAERLSCELGYLPGRSATL